MRVHSRLSRSLYRSLSVSYLRQPARITPVRSHISSSRTLPITLASKGSSSPSETPFTELVPPSSDSVTDELSDDGNDDVFDDDTDLPSSRFVNTGNVAWGERALSVARRILQRSTFSGRLGLYSYHVVPGSGSEKVIVRLESFESAYGSPQLEDIESFAKAFRGSLEEEEPEITPATEVSSPGAERLLKLPDELDRFKGIPMRVCYYDHTNEAFTHDDDASQAIAKVEVLDLIQSDQTDMSVSSKGLSSNAVTLWAPADVRANWRKRGKKVGQRLNAKERRERFQIPMHRIKQVNLHIDV